MFVVGLKVKVRLRLAVVLVDKAARERPNGMGPAEAFAGTDALFREVKDPIMGVK